MKKHFFFDMDMTLTESTQKISESMKKAMARFLNFGADVVVVSGARKEKMIEQLGATAEECALLAQNGNHAESASGSALWTRELTWIQKYKILDLLYEVIDLSKVDPLDLVQDRGCQISYSLIGHNADLDLKRKADPTQAHRKAIIESNAGMFKRLENVGVQCAIGGTTCIDFYTHTKGMNVAEFIKERGWLPEECVYVGDALYPGGNDHTVVGVIDTVQVSGPVETENFIKQATELMRGQMDLEEDDDHCDDDDEEDDDDL